jgi:RNA polymerase sigma-70 factor, ECF subfamily
VEEPTLERDLVIRARAGDETAFEDLIAARLERLYATAKLILHDPVLAEDAVQETMINAWRDLPGLRDPERFDGWLRRILTHTCLNLTRRSRHDKSSLELDPDAVSTADISGGIVEREALDRAFSTLSAEHRTVIVLRYYLGSSVPEMADTLGLRLGTAKSRLSRAEAALRAALEADGRLAPEGGAA